MDAKHLLTTKLAASESLGDYGGSWKLLIVAVEREENCISLGAVICVLQHRSAHNAPVFMFSVTAIGCFPPVNMTLSLPRCPLLEMMPNGKVAAVIYTL